MGNLTRRAALGGTALLLPALPSLAAAPRRDRAGDRLDALEKRTGARIGLAAVDTGSGRGIFYREAERFLMCSTWKFPLVAAVLARVDAGTESLSRQVHFTKADLVPYAPVTSRHVDAGMTVGALCEAAITVSDNAAANLLLAAVGSFPGFNHFIRSLRDRTTRLDRNEPLVNRPDGDKDTTTPVAMLGDMKTILLGNVLSAASRQALMGWLAANTTGDTMLRAGLPRGWAVGDKTGHGDTATNDLAIATPPGRAPVLIAAFTAGGDAAALAEIGRTVAAAFS